MQGQRGVLQGIVIHICQQTELCNIWSDNICTCGQFLHGRQKFGKKELEEIVNTVNDNIIVKLRKQFPKFKPADIDLLCYIYAGFSAQIISVIIGDSVSNIYNRKSRLKARIAASDSAEKDFFIQKMQ